MCCCVAGELVILLLKLRQVGSLLLERTVAIKLVGLVGQQLLVFGVGDKEEPKEDDQRHFISVGEVFWGRAPKIPGCHQALRQLWHNFAVDALTQASGD